MEEEPRTSDSLHGLQAGSRFGRYRLRRLLGRGGFGYVWEAEDTAKDRVVALKLLRSDYSENEAFRQRLFREARAAGRLHEVHVVPIHDYGEIDGQLFIDMRLIDGTDLEAVLSQGGPMAPARAVAVVQQIAAALDAAHNVGLTHRDVKPANIVLTSDDFACLLDFGLASAASDAKLTSTGTTVGTFAYMAPERLRTGGEIDHRVDVYALACVLYECLTGSRPYSGDMPAVISAHLTDPIPLPSRQRPGIPIAFDAVIARGMAKSTADRYSSAGDLARAAQHALTGGEQIQAETIAASAPFCDQPDTEFAASQSPTVHAPRPRPPVGTRQFSARCPNPDGSGETPYADNLHAPPPPERKVGHWRLVLVAGAVAAFVAAALIAALLILRNNQEPPPSASDAKVPTAPTTGAITTKSSTLRTPLATSRPLFTLPDADGQGFLGYPAGRCDPGSTPAVMGRTTQSLVVVCEDGPANYYYRGVRLSDSASIELANAVRSSGGFDVTNPVDGTRYRVRPTGISITSPSGQVFSEPMIEYWPQ
ncbi:serine/threonine-protein kinase [Mycobacterium sp.]|uniref:serine/threonine-protein kinase n=1 Tax=Mycobacterium sp. TaxID=1785 RepID=UPI0011F6C7DD|nr:serine/threonine-protein kinase [Mycobacterium sp.]TAM69153.1 MAG: serine/threonine protein kinase [Mycobacterium sp.]